MGLSIAEGFIWFWHKEQDASRNTETQREKMAAKWLEKGLRSGTEHEKYRKYLKVNQKRRLVETNRKKEMGWGSQKIPPSPAVTLAQHAVLMLSPKNISPCPPTMQVTPSHHSRQALLVAGGGGVFSQRAVFVPRPSFQV